MDTFEGKEKYATLIFDEMAITQSLQFDNALSMVVGKPTLKSSDGNETLQEFASHTLVYMLGGVSTRRKQ